ncbi:hypothetical protein [Amorphus sp. MBR-141]
MAREYADDALATLATIHADDGAPAAARVSAASAILDRAFGKAPQSMALSNPDGSSIGPSVIKLVAAGSGNDDSDG